MNGNGVSGAHGPGLNGAGDFYYEAVEGAQSPGGLLLSPAAFINPALYASVLEGRFKQLQGELRGQGAAGWDVARAQPTGNYKRPRKSLVLAESGKAWGPG